jgi:hypothetical protein
MNECLFKPMCLALHEVRVSATAPGTFSSRLNEFLLLAINECAAGNCYKMYAARSVTVDYPRPSSPALSLGARLAGPIRLFAQTLGLPAVSALRLKLVQTEGRKVDKFRKVLDALAGEFLWACILIPILAISWLGFYTIARAVGVPPVFAAGMSAAFDGVALFAARIGLKHRRKGFSGYLARITVLAFAALGAFVQSFHSETSLWVHEHAWIVWATAPVAAVLAYELHLGWVHRRQLIRHGYTHPSAKSGFGPATWFLLKGTFKEYKDVLRARRDYIAETNFARFRLEEDSQPVLEAPKPEPPKPAPKPKLKPRPQPRPEPQSPPGPRLHSVKPKAVRQRTKNMEIAAWWTAHGGKLGHNGRIPIEGLRAYRAAHPAQAKRAA